MALKLHDKCPDFSAKTTGNKTVTLSMLKGKPFILYFYPKDDTPGCTQEGQDFCANYGEFTQKGIKVFGISPDSLPSHEKFKSKFQFPFDLIVDDNKILCNLFDVIKTKNRYGKEVQGVERSTFLFDGKSELIREWRRVTVKGHVGDVYEAATQLSENQQ